MIKNDNEYSKRAVMEGRKIKLLTDTAFTKGKRMGVLSIEEEAVTFREVYKRECKRSKPIARTAHFSVLERPDGSIAGTFRFDPNKSKIKGTLSAEFWQAITLALTVKENSDEI